MGMKIGVTVWGNRISPVFDSARKLLVAQVENSKLIDQSFEEMELGGIGSGLEFFEKQEVKTLICGAITVEDSDKFEKLGIRLVPFIAGNAREVLNAFAQDEKLIFNYLMPGTLPKFDL